MLLILLSSLFFLTAQTEPIMHRIPLSENEELTIQENLHGGRVLMLNDHSIWEVSPSDIEYTQLWVTPFPVKISRGRNPKYPFVLTNLASETSVDVRRVSTTNPEDLPKEPPGYDKAPKKPIEETPIEIPPEPETKPKAKPKS